MMELMHLLAYITFRLKYSLRRNRTGAGFDKYASYFSKETKQAYLLCWRVPAYLRGAVPVRAPHVELVAKIQFPGSVDQPTNVVAVSPSVEGSVKDLNMTVIVPGYLHVVGLLLNAHARCTGGNAQTQFTAEHRLCTRAIPVQR